MSAPRQAGQNQDTGHVLGRVSLFRAYDVLENTVYLSISPSQNGFGVATSPAVFLRFRLFPRAPPRTCPVCPALQMILKPHLKGKT